MTKNKRIPKVRIASPGSRPLQLRYLCPEEGREIRISTGTYDLDEAEQHKKDLEAKLRLGIDARPRKKAYGPRMAWEDFREEYSRLKVATFRSEQAMDSAEVRLDVCERIGKPRTLGDMARPETWSKLQAELLIGTASEKGPRSPQTVRSYMRALKAALNWAHEQGWLDQPCKFKMLAAETEETLKGRPLTEEEFKRLLKACDSIFPEPEEGRQLDPAGPDSWRFLLRGLWESGLRIGEAMELSWDDESQIMPLRTRGGGYLLRIPARYQKNRKTQEVPTTPAFGALLDEVPPEARVGWIFNPAHIGNRKARYTAHTVGQIITRIGEKAQVFVSAKGKAASAHDLRRSFGQRLADAGVPLRDLQAVMRHASFRTTEKYYLRHEAIEQAERLGQYLGTPAKKPKRKGPRLRTQAQ